MKGSARGILQLLFLPLILILALSGVLTAVKWMCGDQPFCIVWRWKEAGSSSALKSAKPLGSRCAGGAPGVHGAGPLKPGLLKSHSPLHLLTCCHTAPPSTRGGRPGVWHCPSATFHEGQFPKAWGVGEGLRRLGGKEKMNQQSSS